MESRQDFDAIDNSAKDPQPSVGLCYPESAYYDLPTIAPVSLSQFQKRMNLDSPVLQREVDRYLATGESDPLGSAFPGSHALERITSGERHLRTALIEEVRRREQGRRQAHLPAGFDPVTWTRRKVEPMITGLFPASERAVVLQVAEESMVFLTREAAHQAMRETSFLDTAWTIANLYLNSLGAPMLGDGATPILGKNLGTMCYVSIEYFAEQDPFADYVTHEAAHIFHNCKRRTIGLPQSRSKEWLLDIAFTKRETFAFACEAYVRILEHARGKAHRQALLKQYSRGPKPPADMVDQTELLDILVEAVEARNGWKRILARCARSKQPTPNPALAHD